MTEKKEIKMIELLAPAKNLEFGVCAINCGADAVYIGGPSFGARASAGNSLEDIAKLVDYAHKFNAKVYVAVNTIFSDNEIIEAQKLIEKLYKINVDALIIQDMGLLECELPPIPIHASTQTHNATAEKVKFLESCGFERVILARELGLEQIKEIKNTTKVELEAFVHGALCVSYSGRCYMSYAIGKRSANRGECAQPCRKKYSLIDEKGNFIAKESHLLCLKDLNQSQYLKDLIEAGITSFKIEGRLKDLNYVKNVVTFYRQELDKILEEKGLKKVSSGRVYSDFIPDLNKTFNRGYSNYFLNGRYKNIISFDTPKFKGEKLGKVQDVKGNTITIRTETTLTNGDGVCFFDQNELKGAFVNRIEGNKVTLSSNSGISKGTVLYRNFDKKFNDSLEKAKIERKIDISLNLFEKDCEIVLKARDEDDFESYYSIKNEFEEAKNYQNAVLNYQKNLSKTGGTIFNVKNVEINLAQIPFIPVSLINEMRRNVCEKLEDIRIKNYKKNENKIKKQKCEYPLIEAVFEENILNQKAKSFYEKHNVKVVEMAAESGLDMAGKRVMTTKHCLRYAFGMCLKQKSCNVDSSSKYKILKQVQDDAKLFLVDEKGKKYSIKFNCQTCEMEVIF